jgi:hypothetical protein
MLIGTITGHKSKYVVIKYVVIIVCIYNCIVSGFSRSNWGSLFYNKRLHAQGQTCNLHNKNHRILIDHHTLKNRKSYTYIRYINIYATNRISIHSLTITGHKSKYVVIKYVVIIVCIYNCIVSEF